MEVFGGGGGAILVGLVLLLKCLRVSTLLIIEVRILLTADISSLPLIVPEITLALFQFTKYIYLYSLVAKQANPDCLY